MRYSLERHKHDMDEFVFPDPPDYYFLRDDGQWVPISVEFPDAGVDTRFTEYTKWGSNVYEGSPSNTPVMDRPGGSGGIKIVDTGDANDQYYYVKCTRGSLGIGASYSVGTWSWTEIRVNTKHFDMSASFMCGVKDPAYGPSTSGPEEGFVGVRAVDDATSRIGVWADPDKIYAYHNGTRVPLADWDEGTVYRFLITCRDGTCEITVRDSENVDVSHTFTVDTDLVMYPEPVLRTWNANYFGELIFADVRVRTPIEGF